MVVVGIIEVDIEIGIVYLIFEAPAGVIVGAGGDERGLILAGEIDVDRAGAAQRADMRGFGRIVKRGETGVTVGVAGSFQQIFVDKVCLAEPIPILRWATA